MKVLIIDDEKNLRESLIEFCGLEGLEAVGAGNGLSAQKLILEDSFAAVAVDLRMPGMSGLEFLSWLKNEGPDIPVVMMSAYGEVQDAVTALQTGALDYLVKPFEPEELVLRLKKIISNHRIISQVNRQVFSENETMESDNALMQEALSIIQRAAPSDATILLTGESGTGKEVAARHIHKLSVRSEGPFIPINIGGIPETLLESELFGYEKGAFTGAEKRKPGLIETAVSGTLFLDELGELSMPLQVKLLRVIQERKLQRLGGTTLIPVDIRIVAATNRDLEQRVKEGFFREDLFYRINVIHIKLPALRERKEDLPVLAGFLLQKLCRRLSMGIRTLQPDVIEAMKGYQFPGNIRELENMMERALILSAQDNLGMGDFPVLSGVADEKEFTSRGTLKQMEILMIKEALLRNEGHREKTSAELGITRRTLLNKMKEYSIPLE